MDESRRVIEYVCDIAHNVKTEDGYISASQMLERFLFPTHMHSIPVGRLSGGEKRRLYLLGILMSAPNVLLLDEPTNDLDIETLCILENYLDTFQGAVIAVSHDRHFIDRVAKHVFVYEGDEKIGHYMGGYSDWSEIKEFREAEAESVKVGQGTRKGDNRREEKPKKLKFTFKEQKEYETIDDDIAELEAKLEEVEEEINSAGSDYGKLQKLTKEREELSSALDEKMERWEYLNDLAQKIRDYTG